ncbi:MAG TPA: ATP-dependent DNA ligase, partial [Caulobacteraceae bacterium]|nr:ATP-dependent DNA ligase [Caulobacteraceae bacterium]
MARKKQGIEELLWPRAALPYQHPKLVSTPPVGPGWLHEVKFDGWRFQIHVRDGRARLFTRNGLDYSDQLPNLAAVASELPNCVLDAELCYIDESGYSSFSGLKQRLTPARDAELTFMAFDILWRDETDQRPYALERRKQTLLRVLAEAEHVSDYVR